MVADDDSFDVRLLAIDEVDLYLRQVADVEAGSGVDGPGHSHPYSSFEPLNLIEARSREVTRWSTSLDQPGWRRASSLEVEVSCASDHRRLTCHVSRATSGGTRQAWA